MILNLLLIGFLFVLSQIHILFGQLGALEQMISHMRLTHSQLANNIDEVKQLIETNHTSEAHTLLEGMDVKINHMNIMFNDLVWELSNRGH